MPALSDTSTPRPSWLRRVVAFAVMLVFTELLLRALFCAHISFGSPPNCGVHPEILARLYYAYSSGHYSTLPLRSDITKPDPNRGYRTVPHVQIREVSGAPLHTNSLGVRGTREYAMPKPAGVSRIVALGDSLTFGEGLADNETWPAQLESALPNTEVVNFGERGYAHDQMYFALQDDGLPLKPDAVILGFFENDVWRDVLTYYCYEKPRLSKVGDSWQFENIPVPTPTQVRNRYLAMPLLYAIPHGLIDALSEPSMSVQGGEDRAAEIIDQIRAKTLASGARFILVNIPEHLDAPPSQQGFFHDYCARTGVECVDTWPQYRLVAGTDDPQKIKERFLRPHDIHYSREGYAVVAAELRKYLSEHPLVPGSHDARPEEHAGPAK
jgi:hypothetical protein